MPPQVLSATVKTPASASILAQAFKVRLALRRAVHQAIDEFEAKRYGWLHGPCRRIAVWLEAIYRGAVLDPAEDIT